ncbi:hypothetical protein [Paenibacillus sp. PDC88]|uniref:hypothetical protein n=1 Tax=Paenibacillus sp. PDC88 TaxID=1884375 RepID=UPI000894E9A6|nr:hypothetical protein [Paenibacillus sp. PDC88]SDX05591.1 hypothetical protein SAMN05518848_104219 [Paenibacillus sp. PDC88]
MRKFKNIALVFGGVLIGVMISYAPDLQAAASKLLGEKVAKVITVKKDGQAIGDGAIINGTTYLPVRSLVNSLDGIEVGKVSSTEVNLESTETEDEQTPTTDYEQKGKEEQQQIEQNTIEQNAKANELRSEIRETQKQINDVAYNAYIEQTSAYKSAKSIVESYENKTGGSIREADYKIYKAELDKMIADKQVAETKLPELESKLADLKSQLASLEG